MYYICCMYIKRFVPCSSAYIFTFKTTYWIQLYTVLFVLANTVNVYYSTPKILIWQKVLDKSLFQLKYPFIEKKLHDLLYNTQLSVEVVQYSSDFGSC